MSATRSTRRWPIAALAAPAAVAIWSGWVGLGGMSGFGIVHPLPGIVASLTVNTAITLPIGVEAYAAYALGAWLSPRPMPQRARAFAGWSAGASLLLGLIGQVIYHLLVSGGAGSAPSAVVVFVACLPVVVLGAGATLHHLLEDPEDLSTDERAETQPELSTAGTVDAAPAWDDRIDTATSATDVENPGEEPASTGAGVVGVDVTDLLVPGREVAAQLEGRGQRLSRKVLIEGLRATGLSCSTDRAGVLLAQLRTERADHIGQLEAVAG